MDEIKKIEQAALSKGDNETHLQLMRGVVKDVQNGLVTRVADMGGMSDNILVMLNLLNEELEKEDAAIINLNKNELTDPIAEADKDRDKGYSGLRYYVRAYSYSLDEAKVEAARRLQVLIDNYGNMNNRSYNKQSEALRNFLEDVASYNAGDVTVIGADEWIDLLQETNDKVIALMEERFALNIDRASEIVRDVRSRADGIFYRIAAMLESGYMISNGASYGGIIDRINERIRYYRTSLAQHKGRLDAKKEDGED